MHDGKTRKIQPVIVKADAEVITHNPELLKRIDVKYLENYQELLTLFAHFHLVQELPYAIVLDDLNIFRK